MANFQWERLVLALGAVSSMERVLELTLDAAPGGALVFRHAVAEMAMKATRRRAALTYHALRLFTDG